jgi:hypothetical protein
MAEADDLLKLPDLLLKRLQLSFGLPLVLLGFFVVYFKASLGSGAGPPTVTDYYVTLHCQIRSGGFR